MAKGHARQDKLAANPLSASSRTSAQKDAMAQKQARAGNLSRIRTFVEKRFSRPLFQKEAFEIWGCSFV